MACGPVFKPAPLLLVFRREILPLAGGEVLAPVVAHVADADQAPARGQEVAVVAGRVAPALVRARGSAGQGDVLARADRPHAGEGDAVARARLARDGRVVREESEPRHV